VRPILLCALVALASSPLAAQRSRRACPDTPVDSIPSGKPVYQACQVDREAKERGFTPRMDWTPPVGDLRDGSCFRADFEFVVDTLGVPEVGTIHDIRVTDASLQEAVRDVIRRLRYEPAQLKGGPVRQVVAYSQTVAVRRVVTSSRNATPPSSRPPRC